MFWHSDVRIVGKVSVAHLGSSKLARARRIPAHRHQVEGILHTAGAQAKLGENHGNAGVVVADDSRISPRLGASWDVNGDGNWVLNASAARYVTAVANTVASQGGAGSPSSLYYEYGGPMINTDGVNVCGPDHPELCQYTSFEANEIVFNWFDSAGGLSNTDLWYAGPNIRGVNTVVENLASPYADEFTVGFSKRLGTRGLVRADYVHREYHDFYATQRNLETGTVLWEDEVAPGVIVEAEFDLGVVVNEDSQLSRKYDGLHTALQYRFNDKLQIGATYTLSRAYGNVDGETSNSGPVTSSVLNYPEYNSVGQYDEATSQPTSATTCALGCRGTSCPSRGGTST